MAGSCTYHSTRTYPTVILSTLSLIEMLLNINFITGFLPSNNFASTHVKGGERYR